MLKRVSPGQSIGEYTVTGVLLAVVAIAGMMLMGGRLVEYLQGLQDDMMSHQTAAVAVATPPATVDNSTADESGKVNATRPKDAVLSDIPPGALVLKLADGSEVDLSNYPANVRDSVTTVGANGTTEKYVQTLEALIMTMEANQDITADQANLLWAVANQGHKVAGIEKIYEDAFANGGAAAMNAAINYDGWQTTPAEVIKLIGFGSQQFNPWGDPNTVDFGYGPETENLYSLLNQAKAQGALADPVAEQAVNILVDQIAGLADGLESGAARWEDGRGIANVTQLHEMTIQDTVLQESYRTQNGGVGVSGSLNNLPTGIAASEATNTKSGRICGVGNGVDSGTNCSGG